MLSLTSSLIVSCKQIEARLPPPERRNPSRNWPENMRTIAVIPSTEGVQSISLTVNDILRLYDQSEWVNDNIINTFFLITKACSYGIPAAVLTSWTIRSIWHSNENFLERNQGSWELYVGRSFFEISCRLTWSISY